MDSKLGLNSAIFLAYERAKLKLSNLSIQGNLFWII